jgi:hypothetical protein
VERILFAYRGLFQCWSYTVSHGQLLFRSTKSPKRKTQVDVVFKDVRSVSLRTVLRDFELLETDVDPERVIRETPVRFFVVRSQDYEGTVVAGTVVHDEGAVVAGTVVHDEGDHEYHEDRPSAAKGSCKVRAYVMPAN